MEAAYHLRVDMWLSIDSLIFPCKTISSSPFSLIQTHDEPIHFRKEYKSHFYKLTNYIIIINFMNL
jgi:hypothetical protein